MVIISYYPIEIKLNLSRKYSFMEEAELRRVLSTNIKHYRGLRKWSQVVLAEKIGMSTNFLADIETGKSWVSPLTLTKLANIFEIEVYELFKSQKTPKDETKETIRSMMNDISVTIEHSLKQITIKYLN
jgi:transcriptional regulator with XRE-family HTH domain